MTTMGRIIRQLQKTVTPFTKTAQAIRNVPSPPDLRRIIGGHTPRGVPLVHLRCACNKRVATIEDSDTGLVTLWRGRRFPGIPNVECPEHGRLRLEPDKIRARLRSARQGGSPTTLRLSPLG